MGREFAVLAGLFALLGTALQMRDAVQEIRRAQDEVRAFRAIEELRDEYRWYRPVKRRRQHQAVKRLLAESPTEAAHWRAIHRTLFAWALLTAAAFCAFLGTLLGA